MKKLLIPAIIISLGIILFSFHNDFLYKDKILKITKIETIEEDYDYNDLGIKETIYKEKITGILTNTKEKGNTHSYIHERTNSNVADEKYYIGDKVIIKNGNIDTLKRDQYLVTIAVLFILGLIVIGSYRGLLITISVFFNIILLLILLELYQRNIPFTISTILISIIYIVTSLYVASGKNKKTIAAILSVFLSQGILFIILEAIAKTTNFNGLNFNLLSYLTVPPDTIFLESLFIGGLGAIMDVAITMSSSIFELKETSKNITRKEIIKSSKQIGSDILPTMINVLFFTYFSSELALFVLAIRNGFTVSNFIHTFYPLEITRLLTGSIGIVLTIPVAIYTSLWVYQKEGKK